MRTLLYLLASIALVQGLALPFRIVTQNDDGAHKYSVQLAHLVSQYWVTNITIGTPGQTFLTVIDTTSSALWVADTSCSSVCYAKNTFNSSKSSSFMPTSGQFITNSSLGITSGLIGQDNVKLGNDDAKAVTIPNAAFGQANNLPSTVLLAAGVNGVLGLGFPALAPYGLIPIMNDAVNKGAVKKATVVIWFEDQNETDDMGTGGTIYYGDDDYLHCVPNATYVPLSRASLWQYTTPSVAINGVRSPLSNIQTVIDTSSAYIRAPSQVVNAALQSLNVKLPQTYPAQVPCSSKITISFLMNNSIQNITELNLVTKDANGNCYLALLKSTVKGTDGGNRFELGSPFLRGRCLFFDIANEAIGFSDAATHD